MFTQYDVNETMQILGQAKPSDTITALNDINNVFNAYNEAPRGIAFDLALDMFNLGIIYGKKAERAKRKHTKVKPICKFKVNIKNTTTQHRQFELLELTNAAAKLDKRCLTILTLMAKQLGV